MDDDDDDTISYDTLVYMYWRFHRLVTMRERRKYLLHRVEDGNVRIGFTGTRMYSFDMS